MGRLDKSKITHAYLDLDSVAYVGACIAQKMAYKFINKVSGESSEEFSSANEAKAWIEEQVDFYNEKPDDWERISIVKDKPESDAIKFVEQELKNWIKSIKDLTKNPDIILKGYLTSSGLKDKDKGGLEDRYQFNRYEDTENWIPKEKPTHLKACRNHLLTVYDWVKMSPKGIEADAIVVYQAEKRGKTAVICSKDKDLKQVMNSHFIDMNDKPKKRILKFIDQTGS